MPPSSHRSSVPEELVELTPAVHRLAELVQGLATALDELTQEIQWQNREFSPRASPTHLPLTRLPLDPTAKDWHPQWGQPTESNTPGQSVPSPDQIDQLSRSVRGLSSEIARVQQIAAMLIIARCGEELTDEEADAWDAVVRWAYEELDFDCLRESLPEYFESDPKPDKPAETSPPLQPRPPVGERQNKLFTDDAPDDSTSAQ